MLLLSLLALTSCFDATDDSTTGQSVEATSAVSAAPPPITSGAVRFMRMHPKREAAFVAPAVPAAIQAHLTYYGGPVISHVKVVQVNWNANVRFQSELAAFYTAVVNSRHMDWLSEYNTPSQTIGRGSFLTSVVDPAPPTGTTVSDAKIQQEVQRLIMDGTVPAPDADTLYMVHFPPGVRITQGGSSSCQAFCAYHGSFHSGAQRVYYGVIPDMGGNCSSGCGSSTPTNNTQVCASHELMEAVTDGAVAEATTNGPPLAWYDDTPNHGEIGDICYQFEGTVDGIYVQSEWSNALNDCIYKNDAVPPPTTNAFSLTVTPSAQTVVAGNMATFTVTTAVTAGVAESVALEVTGLPAGATASFAPPSAQAGSTVTLTVQTTSAAHAGTTTITVKGTATSNNASDTALLTIMAAPPPPPDAGPPPAPDAGPPAAPDAGPPAAPDAGPPGTPDASPPGTPDAGPGSHEYGDDTGGCGCEVGGRSSGRGAAGFATLALLGLVSLVRRRRRS
jgi:MYXO-CTERM domain-containing protein